MELKDMIAKVEEKLGDAAFKENIMKNPLKAVEELLGVKIPEETLKQILDAVKDKVDIKDIEKLAKEAGEKLGGFEKIEKGIEGAIEGFLHKK